MSSAVNVKLCPSSDVKLPIAIRMPYRLFTSDESVLLCMSEAESALLFGDIITPGLLIAHCHYWDQLLKVKNHIYFAISVIGYGIGLVATFMAARWTQRPQPPLLYLVPFTIIPVLLVSHYRKELMILLEGPDKHSLERRSAPNNAEDNRSEEKKDN